jgi:hypothetical protein
MSCIGGLSVRCETPQKLTEYPDSCRRQADGVMVVQYRKEEVNVVASFEESALSERVLKVLQLNGLKEPTPIQVQTIPAILAGEKDIVSQAQTVFKKGQRGGRPLGQRRSRGRNRLNSCFSSIDRKKRGLRWPGDVFQ